MLSLNAWKLGPPAALLPKDLKLICCPIATNRTTDVLWNALWLRKTSERHIKSCGLTAQKGAPVLWLEVRYLFQRVETYVYILKTIVSICILKCVQWYTNYSIHFAAYQQ